jgi:hypothetical protein
VLDGDTMPEIVGDDTIPYGNEARSTRKVKRDATDATVLESDEDASSHTNLSDFADKHGSCPQLEMQPDGQSPPPL